MCCNGMRELLAARITGASPIFGGPEKSFTLAPGTRQCSKFNLLLHKMVWVTDEQQWPPENLNRNPAIFSSATAALAESIWRTASRIALERRDYRVFLDFEVLKGGKFTDAILRKIEEATDFVVILTPGSLDRMKRAKRKLANPFIRRDSQDVSNDWMRREIAYALTLDKNVVPIFTEGFEMPTESELPDDVAALVSYHGLTPHNDLFEESLGRLCEKFLQSQPASAETAAPVSERQEEPTRIRPQQPVENTRAAESPKPLSDIKSRKKAVSKSFLGVFKSPYAHDRTKVGGNTPNTEIAKDTLNRAWRAYGDKNYALAMKLYSEASDAGNPLAMTGLALIYWKGTTAEADRGSAELYFQKATNAGYPEANLEWACLLIESGDTSGAEALLERTCELGNEEAFIYLGLLRFRAERKQEAEVLFTEAVRLGGCAAACTIAGHFQFGKWVQPSEEQRVKWLARAADLGDGLAASIVGSACSSGNGVTKDEVMALKWYRRAVDLGYGSACSSIGNAYRFGQGVPEDLNKAIEWYRKGAKMASGLSMSNLGDMYREGNGVRQDRKLAIDWYRKAVKAGYKYAEKDLKRLGASVE